MGGAGVALFEMQQDGLALIQWRAQTLPSCPDKRRLATELVAEEMQRRHYSVSQAFLQGDILPLVKHLAFAGRFRRPDLQHTSCMILGKGNHGTLTLESGCTVPERANVVSDYLAGVASRSAQQAVLADEDAMPFDVEVPAPYRLAPESGAIVLDKVNGGVTILHLLEQAQPTLAEVGQFLAHPDHAIDEQPTIAYLSTTAGLRNPKLVQHTASAIDDQGLLYGRGTCAQKVAMYWQIFPVWHDAPRSRHDCGLL